MSTTHRPRASSGRPAYARALRCAVALIVVLVSTVLATVPAAAYWTASGSGGASVSTATLTPPTDVTVPASAISDVDVSWTPGTGGVTPQGYYVTRYAGDVASPACGTSSAHPGPVQLETGTTCTDEGAPDGQHTYAVTAVYNTWTAPSDPSGAVDVVNAAQLGFVAQPTDTVTDAPISPPVTVALQASDGSTVAVAGVPVTVSVTPSVNSSPVPLDGTLTVETGEDGVAVFDDLAIEPTGSYTLTATSPAVTEAVSDPFTVLPPPLLDDAASFSVLGRTGVTNDGFTLVSGDLGVSPSTSVVGFPDGVVAGDIHAGDAAAADAQSDLLDTYNELWLRAPTQSYPAANLGGQTLLPGLYSTAAALGVTGTATLDADGDPDAIFILRVGGALNTAASSAVVLANGAQAANVFWVVTGAVTTGASTTFVGTILAEGAITLGDGTDLTGRALSRGTVTLAGTSVQFSRPLPTIAMTGPASPTKDTTPTITGTTTVLAGRTVRVSIGAQTLTATVQPGGSWSVTATSLVAGSYPVVAKVKDPSGNGAVASQTLVVEVNPAPVALGSTASFSVLARTSVVNTGPTTVSGDLGVSPSAAVSGFPPGTVAGDIHAANATSAAAQTDLAAAITDAAGRAEHTRFSGVLGGRTFHVGVHHSTAAMALTGNVTLDGEGDTGAVFIFQGDAALNTAAASTVTLANGAQAANVFWVITGAVSTASSFPGTILTQGAITLGASTTVVGRALSRDAVTLSSNTIRFTTSLPPTMTIDGGSAAVTKEPAPTFTGTSSAGTGQPVTVTVGGQSLSTTVQQGGTWSVAATALAAGSYPVVARVRDVHGNGATATQTLTVESNPASVDLGTAAGFSMLGGTGVVNTGTGTHLADDLGLSPQGAISGFSPDMYGGELHDKDSTAAAAQTDLLAAIDDAAGRPKHTEVSGNLANQTFHAGVHHSTPALALTGTVTLDGEGDANAVFIFQTGAAMTTAASSNVNLVNGAQASNVFWVIGGAFTAGAPTSFQGTILSTGAVTLGDGTTLTGRVLSRGTVTLANTTIETP